MTTRTSHDVFLSFAHTDGGLHAEALRLQLEQRGFSVWVAPSNLHGGEVFTDAIGSALSTSSCLVVLCTPGAARSDWVKREVAVFIERDNKLSVLPVVINGGHPKDVHPELHRVHSVEASSHNAGMFERVADAVAWILRTRDEDPNASAHQNAGRSSSPDDSPKDGDQRSGEDRRDNSFEGKWMRFRKGVKLALLRYHGLDCMVDLAPQNFSLLLDSLEKEACKYRITDSAGRVLETEVFFYRKLNEVAPKFMGHRSHQRALVYAIDEIAQALFAQFDVTPIDRRSAAQGGASG